MLKRAFDIIASGAGLIVLSPLLILIALIVRATSPGPALYQARRVGRHGTEFKLYKFRSMRPDADKAGPKVTVKGDPRITPVGRILRKTKFDELPQLLNVLKGDMSLVGPRPEDPKYVALYTPAQRAVLNVRPGITSPASVTYRDEESVLARDDWETYYTEVVMPAKLAIDIEYAQNASLWRDIGIIFKTFIAIVRR